MMTFSEKLLKLRKEKGLSQEALAEQLNTSRQAISKWENGQGFPETEKLLMIGNIFEVSIDYLLKSTDEQPTENEKGYYVSKEMAEGFLYCQHKMTKHLALGISVLILSTVPYLVFKESPNIYIILIMIIAALGIAMIVKAVYLDEVRYNVLTKEALIFDQHYLKELKVRYTDMKKKYMPLVGMGICLLTMGGIPFLLSKKEFVASEIVTPYYPVCVFLIAAGAYLLIHTVSVLEAYELLVKNEEHINGFGFKVLKKARKKMDDFL